MSTKLFIEGIPGSGKSSVARAIVRYLMSRDVWYTSDYDILREMCREDATGQQIQSTEHGGILVTDIILYDRALQRSGTQVREKSTEKNDLIIVEFARSDCVRAFSLFDDAFLSNSLFLFLDATISVCLERIRQRTLNPRFDSDYFVPGEVFKRYADKDNQHYLAQIASYLVQERYITPSSIKIVNNNASWEQNAGYIYQAVDALLASAGLSPTAQIIKK